MIYLKLLEHKEIHKIIQKRKKKQWEFSFNPQNKIPKNRRKNHSLISRAPKPSLTNCTKFSVQLHFCQASNEIAEII